MTISASDYSADASLVSVIFFHPAFRFCVRTQSARLQASPILILTDENLESSGDFDTAYHPAVTDKISNLIDYDNMRWCII